MWRREWSEREERGGGVAREGEEREREERDQRRGGGRRGGLKEEEESVPPSLRRNLSKPWSYMYFHSEFRSSWVPSTGSSALVLFSLPLSRPTPPTSSIDDRYTFLISLRWFFPLTGGRLEGRARLEREREKRLTFRKDGPTGLSERLEIGRGRGEGGGERAERERERRERERERREKGREQ